MSMVPAEGVPPGAIAQLYQKGYVLNDRLLRPALVVVANHD
jgi:molecular chaperone GrpE